MFGGGTCCDLRRSPRRCTDAPSGIGHNRGRGGRAHLASPPAADELRAHVGRATQRAARGHRRAHGRPARRARGTQRGCAGRAAGRARRRASAPYRGRRHRRARRAEGRADEARPDGELPRREPAGADARTPSRACSRTRRRWRPSCAPRWCAPSWATHPSACSRGGIPCRSRRRRSGRCTGRPRDPASTWR